MNRAPVMLAFGGGVNSAAVAAGMVERGEPIDAVLFADTGSRDAEKPETYAFVDLFSDWLVSKGYPAVTWVRNDGKYGTLERNCLDTKRLPSPAYGGRSCSEKYKQRPQHKWAKRWPLAQEWWATCVLGNNQPAPPHKCDRWCDKGRVVKLIGYDAGEGHRSDLRCDDFYVYRYPLREWGWTRPECEESLRRHGLTVPTKSACFFCPYSKRREILALAEQHPDLFARAVAIEQAAENTTAKGLGIRWSWQKLLENERAQLKLGFGEPPPMNCICQGEVTVGDRIDSDTESEEV